LQSCFHAVQQWAYSRSVRWLARQVARDAGFLNLVTAYGACSCRHSRVRIQLKSRDGIRDIQPLRKEKPSNIVQLTLYDLAMGSWMQWRLPRRQLASAAPSFEYIYFFLGSTAVCWKMNSSCFIICLWRLCLRASWERFHSLVFAKSSFFGLRDEYSIHTNTNTHGGLVPQTQTWSPNSPIAASPPNEISPRTAEV
jgi:hypothetical protein